MQIRVEKTSVPDVIIIKSEVFQDERGFFSEIYREDQFQALGLPRSFVQLNHSGSSKNVLRGLHFQWDPPMGKLMRVTRGEAFLVAVDIRKGSPTLGKWFGTQVSDKNRLQIYAPAGFARGFCVLSDFAEIQYLCTGIYSSSAESAISWDDRDIGIAWPVRDPLVSPKDRNAQSFNSWLARAESDYFTIDK